MLHYETITSDCQKLLRELMAFDELTRFRLVGGTALALQFGHRISVDLDFFTDKTFDSEALERKLLMQFSTFKKERTTSTGFSAYVENIKIDFYNWSLPFIRPSVEENGLRLCHWEEISAMKLDAVTRRQEKKDYVDIFEMLKRKTLEEFVQIYKEKYPFNNVKIVLEALRVIEFADPSPNPDMLISASWENVKSRLIEATDHFISNQKAIKQKEQEARIAKAQQLLDNKNKHNP